jgi:hypothetical protein
VSTRPASNAVILDRTLRRLRRAGRLDDVCEILAVLAGTSARLVDAVCTPDSETATYAQAACLRVHAAVLSQLSDRLAPVRTGEADPWERIARELEVTSASVAEEERAAAYDAAERSLEADSSRWPTG